MSHSPIKQITLIGLGLMGSSLARALKETHFAHRIVGCSHSGETLAKAKALGIIDAAVASPKDAVKRSDIIMLCTPLGAYASLAEQITPHVKPTAIITDVGSVKQPMLDAFLPHLKKGMRCVPAHPIAGSEKSGIDAGDAQLYQGKKVILTPLSGYSPESALSTVSALWETCGAKVERMKIEAHDRIYAGMSHAIQLLSYSYMHTLSRYQELGEKIRSQPDPFFFPFIRLGASEPVMWRDIFISNQAAVLQAMECFNTRFRHLLGMLEEEPEELLEQLQEAHKEREALPLLQNISPLNRSYTADDAFFALTLCCPRLIALGAFSSFTDYAYAGSGFLGFTQILTAISPLTLKRLEEHKEPILQVGKAFLEECEAALQLVEKGDAEKLENYGREANRVWNTQHSVTGIPISATTEPIFNPQT